MLLKLWNSIRGNSSPAPSKPGHSSKQADRDEPKRKLAKPSKPSRGVLGLGGGPHSALCKQLKRIQAASVLEIGVGDGTRAAAVLQTLQSNSEIQYIAIDQFEMAGSELTLKHFHQQI